ncbi:MAG TPA: DUF3108 domain-containing protein [Verrucomicrobiae bacterium]|nr:DUF3108 domain-containing protein [Verrucomicrobiae bacterium]
MQLSIVKTLTAILGLLLAMSGAMLADGDETIPFSVGEKLTYQIFWGPFVVGRATLEVAGIDPVDGHDCYHLVAKAKTSGLAEWLFPVDSTAESWLDRTGLFTRQYREDRSEGKHHRNSDTHFDYATKETVTKNQVNGRERHTPLDQHVLDVVSSLYYVRTQKLMLDSEQSFTINAGDTNYNVIIRPDMRKTMWVRPVGDVQALRIEPTPTLNIISANNGHMWFWVSDDPRRLPLLVNSELKLGTAKLVLFSITPGKPSPGTTNKSAGSVTLAPLAAKGSTLASER